MELRRRNIWLLIALTWELNMCQATFNQTDSALNVDWNEISVTPPYKDTDSGRTFNHMSPSGDQMGTGNNFQEVDAVGYHQRWLNHHQQQLQNAELMKNDQDTSLTFNRHGEYETYDHLDHDDYHQHPWDHTSMKPFIKLPMKPWKMMDLHSIDFMKIALIAVVKLVLFKIQTIGTFKFLALLLMKIPIILVKIALKVMFVMKVIQILKYLAIPFLLPTLLSLLAPLLPIILPLILLPLLLPLLLLLPIPILAVITTSSTTTSTTTTTVAPNTGRKKRFIPTDDGLKFDRQKLDMAFFRKLVDSEMCLERIACNLAADKKASTFSSLVLWVLDTAKVYVNHPRYKSYFEAYRLGTSSRANKRLCSNYYPCNGLRKV